MAADTPVVMPAIRDVLEHLVKHAPGLGPEHRRQFLAAVHDAFPAPPEAAEAAEPAPDPSGG